MPKKANPEGIDAAVEAAVEEKPYDIWEDMVTIKIPKEKNVKEDVVVRVNDRSFLIQRGVSVDVHRPVFEALRNKEKAEEDRDAYIEANASE